MYVVDDVESGIPVVKSEKTCTLEWGRASL